MLLAIDCGNTNTVFAVYDGDDKRCEWRAASKSGRTADEMGVWLTQLMQMKGFGPEAITDAIIASVVPAAVFELRLLCHRYFSAPPLVVGEPDVDLGLDVLMDRPEEVGADRLVNAVAAYKSYGGPLIVLDFGTATTFDVVDAAGNYCGGVIAPGVNLSLEALHMAAAQLPRVAIGRPKSVIGKATVPAMRSGIYLGYVAMIEGLSARICEEFGSPMTVVATGGLASLFTEATDVIHHLDNDLTLRGLLEIHRRNAAAHAHT
ncbi:type III pantothenate kinase [Roseospira marina]|uniref:Type III pantothenate kinase n=1 Tax=Roseospira marina TaxID=140057 RepID=A0A5M6IAM7_9PROT|nr:type III pantothenate kinase [Roseospira marina]KAA5604769.1 type III pantothenate kinase [Roseospira marina]MBB4313451.1 type III pantothenate kinase [Roseospira marina]MBB5086613.1 type III pantothenate kinase [Roseospira marina]